MVLVPVQEASAPIDNTESHSISDHELSDIATPVVIAKHSEKADRTIVEKCRCYAEPDATLAQLRALLLKDEIMDAGDRFYDTDMTLGKSAEKRLKWKSIAKDGIVKIVNYKFQISSPAIPRSVLFPSPLKLETGCFHTSTLRKWDNIKHDNRTVIHFTARGPPSVPRLLLGLNALDFGFTSDLRLAAVIERATCDSAQINLTSWNDAQHHGSGCAWLSLPPYEDDQGRDFQYGRFNIADDHPWDKPQATTICRIAFACAYAAPPQVVVWLDRIGTNRGANVRLNVWADRIGTEGFTLHVETWGDTKLYDAGVSWLAYPAQRTDIASGAYSVNDVRHTGRADKENSGYVAFGGAQFSSVPRVFMAINSILFDGNTNVRLCPLSASDVSTTGMTWHINTWFNTKMYDAKVSFIAF